MTMPQRVEFAPNADPADLNDCADEVESTGLANEMNSAAEVDPADEIESAVRRALESRTAVASSLGPAFAGAWELASQCALGGKLLRPRLLLGAFDALIDPPPEDAPAEDGSGLPGVPFEPGTQTHGDRHVRNTAVRNTALRIAAGVELLHFSFLLHDDVIDGDLIRRGRPNFIGRQLEERAAASHHNVEGTDHASSERLRWARSSAILIGDMMLSTAHRIFAVETLSPDVRSADLRSADALPAGALSTEVRRRLLDVLDTTMLDSVAGELTDVALSSGRLSSELAAVIEMSRMKTATYSFELPLRAAAVLSASAQSVEDSLGRVGRLLGSAFQLQDDLLSTFGDPRLHGKDSFSDLREGKETAIIAFARRTSAWPAIEPHFGNRELTDQEGLTMRSRLADCGAEGEVHHLIEGLVSSTWDLVSAEPNVFTPPLTRFIGNLIDTLRGRQT